MVPLANFTSLALSIGAYKFREKGWELNSGRICPYFFDIAEFSKGFLLDKLSHFYAQAVLEQPVPDVVFGPSYKGTIPVMPLSMVLGRGEIGWAYNRKEVKDHGEGGIIIGDSLRGKSVGLVDDAITRGGSLARAFDLVDSEGGKPIWAVIAFDRQERGTGDMSAAQEFVQTYQIPLIAISNLDDLIKNLSAYDSDENLPKILEYKKQYCI